MQSPQKVCISSLPPIERGNLTLPSRNQLRDRLQSENRTQALAQAGFQEELKLISEEIQTLRLGSPQRRLDSRINGHYSLNGLFASPPTDAALESRVRELESRFDVLTDEFRGRTSAIEKDLESSLVVSEKRAKKLDELYREASAENEALYDRFNLELNKIVKEVRLGGAEEVLKTQLTAALDEIGRLKKENFRLKREVGGLRAQQAAVSLLRASE